MTLPLHLVNQLFYSKCSLHPIYLSERSLQDTVTCLFKVTNSVFLLCKCMRNSIMKILLEERPPPHTSNHASTSGQPKDDQEMDHNAMPKGGDVSNKSAISCFPKGMDLNLGRVVRDLSIY